MDSRVVEKSYEVRISETFVEMFYAKEQPRYMFTESGTKCWIFPKFVLTFTPDEWWVFTTSLDKSEKISDKDSTRMTHAIVMAYRSMVEGRTTEKGGLPSEWNPEVPGMPGHTIESLISQFLCDRENMDTIIQHGRWTNNACTDWLVECKEFSFKFEFGTHAVLAAGKYLDAGWIAAHSKQIAELRTCLHPWPPRKP